MFYKLRYYISATAIDFAIWILPDDYTRSRMKWGIGMAADLMIKEIDSYNEEDEDYTHGAH